MRRGVFLSLVSLVAATPCRAGVAVPHATSAIAIAPHCTELVWTGSAELKDATVITTYAGKALIGARLPGARAGETEDVVLA